MTAKTFTDASFETDVLNSSRPVLVDFWAPWCGPCKMLSPVIDEIAGELQDITIGKMNVDENPATPAKYGVRGIPTMLILQNGEVKATRVGALPKADLVNWIKKETGIAA